MIKIEILNNMAEDCVQTLGCGKPSTPAIVIYTAYIVLYLLFLVVVCYSFSKLFKIAWTYWTILHLSLLIIYSLGRLSSS